MARRRGDGGDLLRHGRLPSGLGGSALHGRALQTGEREPEPGRDPRPEALGCDPAGRQSGGAADVMRGEETQIAGFLRLNTGWDGVICLPGTHSKWVHVSAGEIISFRTFMTGELYGLLADASVLRHSVGGEDWDAAAFETALSDTIARPANLAAGLFRLRASHLLDGTEAGIGTRPAFGLADRGGACGGASLLARPGGGRCGRRAACRTVRAGAWDACGRGEHCKGRHDDDCRADGGHRALKAMA